MSIEAGETVLGVESFRGRQGRIAFAYLALHHDRSVQRAELADVIWPEALPGSWESDLSAIVSRLRGVLNRAGIDGTQAIASALGCYELRIPGAAVWVDIEEARHAAETAEVAVASGDAAAGIGSATVAKEIARRPFLPGDEAPWLDVVRAELTEVRRRSMGALAEGWRAAGDIRQAIEATEEELKIDVYREVAHRRLISLHAAAGDRAQALRAWARCKELLERELGVDPSPQTQELYLELLRAPAETIQAPAAADRGVVTFLFTDLVGSTELLSLGEEQAESIRRAHFRILRDAVATRGGEEVKSLGDGLIVAFASVRDAVGCAIAMQQAVERHNRTAEPRIDVRIGLHVGEPIRDEQDYFGSAVVVARRLCDDAFGGQILASDLVRGLTGPQMFAYVDAGIRELKGLGEPVIAYEVAWSTGAEETVDLPAILRPSVEPPFVGRATQIAWLWERVAEARSGRLRVAAIPGDPGIGKTRLVSEFASMVHAERTPVLYGRCDEEALVAYQPFVEAIDRYATSASLDDLRRHAGQGAPDLARVVPAVARRLPDLPPPLAGEAESERFRLFEAVASFFGSLAGEVPLVFVMEDVHWADRPTLLLLRHLARQAADAPIVVLATVRDVEVTRRHPLVDVVDALKRDDALTTLPLTGLDDVSVRAIIGTIAGRTDGDLVPNVMRATEGNPLFVRELARHIAETGDPSTATVPESIKELIARRVDRLGDDTLRMLTRAAVVGRDFDLDVLVGLTNATEETVIERLETAVDARVVDEVTGAVDRYTFTHALIRETLHERLTATRRRRLHLRAAHAVERLRAKDLTPYIGELAYHYAEAGDAYAQQVFDYASGAGRQAMRQLAYEDAALQHERALLALRRIERRDPQVELDHLIVLADALGRSGEHRRASRVYVEATERARSLGLRETAGNMSRMIRRLKVVQSFADAVLGLSNSWVQTGLVDAKRTGLLEEALDVLPEAELRRRALVTGKLAHEIYHDPGSIDRRLDLADTALDLARRSGDATTIARCLHNRTFASWGPDTTRDELDAAGEEMVALGRECDDLDVAIQGINWKMMAAIIPNDMDAFDAHLLAYEELASEIRQPRYDWYAQTRRAMRALYRGDLDEGARRSAEAYRSGERIGEADAIHVHLGQMLHVWFERMSDEGIARLRDQVDRTAEAETGHAPSSTLLWWQAAFTAMAVRTGEADEGRRLLNDVVTADLEVVPRDYHWLAVTRSLGEIAYRCSDPRAAAIVHRHLAPYAGRSCGAGGANVLGIVDDALGRLSVILGRPDEAVRYLSDAVREYDRIEAALLAASARWDLARALRERGESEDEGTANDLEAQARATAEHLGLTLMRREFGDLE